MKKTLFKFGELFCGPGGIALGAKLASDNHPSCEIKHVWANDYDETTCATYRKNLCPDDPDSVICKDVRKLDIIELGEIDAFAFGFPCNDFSIVGEQKGFDGTFGPLYSYGVKVLKQYKPKWFLAENVGGLASTHKGKAFKKILKEFKDCGYKLYPHLYKFEEYGVPQARHRIIIVGIRDDIDLDYYPPNPDIYKDKDISCKNAIENPPIEPESFNNELTKQSKRVVERLKHIKPGENAWNADIPEELQLHVKATKLSQIYKRLDPDKPSYTVTGSGGGGTHIYHYDEPRALTNRERARLQTFPDDYEFIGTKENVRRQIGMAVPVEGARIIIEAILNTFSGIEYNHVDCNMNSQ